MRRLDDIRRHTDNIIVLLAVYAEPSHFLFVDADELAEERQKRAATGRHVIFAYFHGPASAR